MPVHLLPLSMDDAEIVLAWRRDPAVAAQLFSERPPTLEEHLAWVSALPGRADRKEFVIVLESGRRVGTIGLSGIDPGRGQAEYGILIGQPEARGKGIAYEASMLILNRAFVDLELQQVVLRLFADNTPARRLYARLGFREDLSRAGRHIRGGVARPTTFMRLSRAAWLADPAPQKSAISPAEGSTGNIRAKDSGRPDPQNPL